MEVENFWRRLPLSILKGKIEVDIDSYNEQKDHHDKNGMKVVDKDIRLKKIIVIDLVGIAIYAEEVVQRGQKGKSQLQPLLLHWIQSKIGKIGCSIFSSQTTTC